MNIRETAKPIVVGAIGTVSKSVEKNWKNWKTEEESSVARLQYYWEQSGHYEEPWRSEEAGSRLDSSEKQIVNAGVKSSQIIKIIYHLWESFIPAVFIYWSLSDSESPQVSRTLHSILTVLNNAVVWPILLVWMVSTCVILRTPSVGLSLDTTQSIYS